MRTKELFVSCEIKRIEDLPDYMKSCYNKSIHTNKTIKKPYGCPNGRRNCSMCHKKENGNFGKNKKCITDSFYD